MKCEVITYEHASNGISLFVVPETDCEKALLRGFWTHGELLKCNGVADGSGLGFAITWRIRDPSCIQ